MTAPRPDPQGLDALTERRPGLVARVAAIEGRCEGLRRPGIRMDERDADE